ncbi:MAG: sigma-70 family RNA polymerase sigma factor [Acidobacteria bacterium]|nr:sigma-70 family RNA polymerase sigma factor [Acidobacteriota bacterium]
MTNDATPRNLLPAIAAGDTVAVADLYDRHGSVLYALLLKILGDRPDAQEVLQESFVQAWRRAADFDPRRGSETAWLVSIARNRAIDRLRSRNLRAIREEEAGREIPIDARSVDTDGGAERQAILGELRERMQAALAELPEPQRSVLELAYFQGLSQSEIATELGEPLGTVKTRTQLAMKKLRERLKDLGWFDDARRV